MNKKQEDIEIYKPERQKQYTNNSRKKKSK